MKRIYIVAISLVSIICIGYFYFNNSAKFSDHQVAAAGLSVRISAVHAFFSANPIGKGIVVSSPTRIDLQFDTILKESIGNVDKSNIGYYILGPNPWKQNYCVVVFPTSTPDTMGVLLVTTGGKPMTIADAKEIQKELSTIRGTENTTLGFVDEDGIGLKSLADRWFQPAAPINEICPVAQGHIGIYGQRTVKGVNPTL